MADEELARVGAACRRGLLGRLPAGQRVLLGLGLIAVITLANLRGLKESGRVFAAAGVEVSVLRVGDLEIDLPDHPRLVTEPGVGYRLVDPSTGD